MGRAIKQRKLPLASPETMATIEQQLIEKQRTIDYDTKEFTVELLARISQRFRIKT